MKEHKKQILAALALALALGMAMPGAVFAVEGTDEEGNAGVELTAADDEDTKAEDDDAEMADDEEETLGLTESVIELNNRVYERESFEGYRDAEELVRQVINARKFSLQSAQYWLEHMDVSDVEDVRAINVVQQSTINKVSGKLVYAAIDDLKADPAYSTNEAYKRVVDNSAAQASASARDIAKELSTLFPDDTAEIAKMDLKQLVEKAETLKDFDKYVNLYESMGFLDFMQGEGGPNGHPVISEEKLNAAYGSTAGQVTLAAQYDAFLRAALAIDNTVGKGLYQVPVVNEPEEQEPAGPGTPDTGIIDWIESGALDMGVLTLIVSTVVAGLAGAGLIAKLYLKHKF